MISPIPLPKSVEVAFRTELPPLMRAQLEALFFFNSKQAKWAAQIRQVVEKHGLPEIKEAGGKITITLRGNDQTQTLFGVNPQQPDQLEGVIIYSRLCYSEILVLHLALAELRVASLFGARATGSSLDCLGLLAAFMDLAKSIAGVERLRLAYWNIAIPVV